MKKIFLLALCILFYTPSAFAAIAFDNSGATTDAGGNITLRTLANYVINTANNTIVIVSTEGNVGSGSDVINGATFCGNAMTAIDNYVGAGTAGYRWVDQFYYFATSTAAKCNISVTGSSNAIIGFNVASYSGVDPTTPLDTLTAPTCANCHLANTANEHTSPLANTNTIITTLSANDWQIMGDQGATCTVGAGTTVRASGLGNGYNIEDSNAGFAIGSNSLICSNTANWTSISFAIRPFVAAAASIPYNDDSALLPYLR